jgi:molybdopterin-biosynthesis enzyme MoeA-like protein
MASPTNIGILVVGDEILTGRRADKHFAHAVETLAGRGLELAWVRYAGDDQALLTRELREIRARGDVCFVFGGIGATPDDRTRQAMAAAHDAGLVRHAGAVKEIEAQFGEAAYPNRILMADLPAGADLIPNPVNRIPGFSMGRMHCLPGFPEMAWPMMEWVLDCCYPQLRADAPVQYTLIAHGAHESELIGVMTALQAAHPAVKLSSLPHFLADGGRQIEFGLRGPRDQAEAAMAALEAALGELHLQCTRNADDAQSGETQGPR